jgi:two-component sensor histidine kinase/CheY-like chemotaxis protein
MRKPLRVIVVEDRATDAELVILELRRAGFDPAWKRVETEAEYVKALETSPELILADYSLPHFDGLSALRRLRERGLDIPFILVSASVGEDVAVEVMKEGADDYLLKDRTARLGAAVEGALAMRQFREERKQAEAYREMGQRVLQILNEPGALSDSIGSVVATLKELTGFDAVGVRLRTGEDFPYAAQAGFTQGFLDAENSLLAKSLEGGLCRDREGRACLEGTCGLVISGRAEPSDPSVTSFGTVWTNDMRPFLDIPVERDARLHPRNRCIHEGYASAALVPIRNEDGIAGLIQFNSRRKGSLTPEMVKHLEEIATRIGAALSRRGAEERLRSALAEKEALLKEVHHRVKNNLQVINSLLRLEISHHSAADITQVLREMQGRVHTMALLHETLYRSGTFASVDLGAYLRQLANQAFRAFVASPGTIEMDLDLASHRVPLDQAIPCGLLVNEMLSNTLKHGFPEGRSGAIRIELKVVGDGRDLSLRISDTGVGLPADFDRKRNESLGLQLVSDLTRQLGGVLAVGPGPGASFAVTFPSPLSVPS